MPRWMRYAHNGQTAYGTLEGDVVHAHRGDPFSGAEPTGRTLQLVEVDLLAPCQPGKIIALWNNFRQLAAKLNQPVPEEPLYLLKAPTTVARPGAEIRRPRTYDGRIVFEGELGIVIGRSCKEASEDEARQAILGYTCVNDITAADILNRDPSFPQWARAKSFDGFCPFGPAIATELDLGKVVVRTLLDGAERQNYALSDAVFQPARLVSLLSRDMTLLPGDLICMGTSLGVGTMKGPVNTVEVVIDGVGTLRNVI
ncbi:2-hydroxyhepta-2,4-diene-1,7-dioate isomerase [Alsobacter soli]|uniref:2-hydroxyhepta-2,4-diene-1,7-dioate isomerase n=1 Tax=Alsobacter soli TaxID=2109933 RepID=A0A2T1HNI9_9HYPH|nr:fumarylacetoacetate hydrolase family protein [Alsobacter soli]PSC03207.1 2-hydroxyhepta-2,4-diene-1,7-dioate isomerase [Alsobacter soli]